MLTAGPITSALAQHNCSLKSLNGAYGFAVTGSNEALGLRYALLGNFVADGNGHLLGKVTQSVSGTIMHIKYSGSYTVLPDCSGSAHFFFPTGIKPTIDFFLVSNGNEILMIVSDNGTVETGDAKKQMPIR